MRGDVRPGMVSALALEAANRESARARGEAWELRAALEAVADAKSLWEAVERIALPALKGRRLADDKAAVERVAAYLCTVSFTDLPDCGGDRKTIAAGCLRAAGETP